MKTEKATIVVKNFIEKSKIKVITNKNNKVLFKENAEYSNCCFFFPSKNKEVTE